MKPLAALMLVLLVGLGGCQDTYVPGSGSDQRTPPQILIWPDPPSLVVDLDHAPGREPSSAFVERLRSELETHTDKQTIVIQGSDEIDVGDDGAERDWSYEELNALHHATWASDRLWDDGHAYMHVMVLNGHVSREDGGRTIGLASSGRIMVFPDTFDNAMGAFAFDLSPFDPTEAKESGWQAILVHEIGHMLGLVDNGAPLTAAHVDSGEECRCHSNNEESVMYTNIENMNVQRFVEEQRWRRDTFDADDLADLAALRAMYPGPSQTSSP